MLKRIKIWYPQTSPVVRIVVAYITLPIFAIGLILYFFLWYPVMAFTGICKESK